MGIYIIFGGCIVLAVMWMLMSLPVNRAAGPGIVLAFDIAITVIVIALFGAGTYAYAGQQNRKAQEAAVQEQESSTSDEIVVPEDGNVPAIEIQNGSQDGSAAVPGPEAANHESGNTNGAQTNDPQGQSSPPAAVQETTAPDNPGSQNTVSEGQFAAEPGQTPPAQPSSTGAP